MRYNTTLSPALVMRLAKRVLGERQDGILINEIAPVGMLLLQRLMCRDYVQPQYFDFSSQRGRGCRSFLRVGIQVGCYRC